MQLGQSVERMENANFFWGVPLRFYKGNTFCADWVTSLIISGQTSEISPSWLMNVGEKWGTVNSQHDFLAEFFTNLSINSVLKIFVVLEMKLMVWLLPPGHGGPFTFLEAGFWILRSPSSQLYFIFISYTKNNFNNLLSNWKLQSIVLKHAVS